MSDPIEHARDLIRQAQTASKGSTIVSILSMAMHEYESQRKLHAQLLDVPAQRRDALDLLLNSSASTETALVLLIPQYLPDLVSDFPDYWPTALDVAYDVSENEDVQVRIKGYQLVVDLAGIGNVEEVGAMTDVLLQMLQTCESEQSCVAMPLKLMRFPVLSP